MKNVKDAIRYGIETLNVSPEMMFSLIESSNGYSGDDYNRWLANEIIKIAEKEGIGYSQLLVKKFSIIQSLIEDYSDNSIQEDWKNAIEKKMEGYSIFSDGIEGIGDELENLDWFSGIDYDEMNSEFLYEKMPEEVKSHFLSGEKTAFLVKMSSDPINKRCDIALDAKKKSIILKTEGGGILYRMCQVVSAFDSLVDNLSFAFVASTDFLTSEDNASAIEYFLRYFNYMGFVVDASKFLTKSFASIKYAVVFCTPRSFDSPRQDGFILKTNPQIVNGVISDKDIKDNYSRYSRSERSLLDYILNKEKDLEYCTLPCINREGEYTGEEISVRQGLGYLNVQGYDLLLSTLPVQGYKSIAFSKDSLKDVIIYYGVATSLRRFGFPSDIKEIMTGHKAYKELLYNCFPLFLFDCGSKFSTHKIGNFVYKNKYAYDLEWVSNILEKGELYFSPEAKEVVYICKGYMDYLKSQKEDIEDKTFEQIRHESNNEELNKTYLNDLLNLYDYISSVYRKMM